MKKIIILYLFCGLILNTGCIADGICYMDCVNREDNCIDDCSKKYPDNEEEKKNCVKFCGNAYDRCMERCDEMLDNE